MKKELFIVGIGILILIAILSSGCFGTDEDGEKKKDENGNEVSIELSHEPENPSAGEDITIIVNVNECSGCSIKYNAFFVDSISGGGSMNKVGDNRYEYQLESFSSGTEIWYMVAVKHLNKTLQVLPEKIIQIGNIERSDITALTISNVHHSPANPTKEIDSVKVFADVTSDYPISSVNNEYMYFSYQGSGGGGGTMGYLNGDTYEDWISTGGGESTKVFYKIAAKDELGNTAVTPTVSFTIE